MNEINHKNWKQVALGEIVDVYDGPHATPKKTKSGPYYLGISTLNKGRLAISDAAHISEEDYQKWTRRITPAAGDIVFSYETRLGEVAMIPEGIRCALGRRMGLLRPKKGQVLSRYLLYAYQSSVFQDVLHRNTLMGSTVNRIPIGKMPDFPITIPPLPEQKTIASILGFLDDKIKLNNQMNQTLETMARALYKSWFVDFDPVVAKAARKRPFGMDDETAALFPDRFVDSELGPIPEGWVIGSLESITKFQSGYAFKSKQWRNEGIPVVRIGNVKPGIVDLNNTVHVEHYLLEFVSDYLLHEGDLIIGMTGNVGTVGLVPYAEQKPLLNQRVGRIITETNELNQRPFLYCTVTETNFYTSIGNRAHGSVQANISGEDIMTIPLIIPSIRLIQTFNRRLKDNFKLLLSNHREVQTLSKLRDLLLHKLISGEIRIKDAEKVVEEAV